MTQSIMLHELDPDGLRNLLAEEISKLQYNPDKFENVIVTADWFCKIHSISRITLQRWIDQGVVIPESLPGEHHRFSLAYILKFDVASIKRRRNKQLILSNNEKTRKNLQTTL